jgi:hypothetical protein
MGHYDESYAHSREEQEKGNKKILVEHIKKLKYSDDVDMLLDILDNIDNWRGLYRLINKI